VHGRVTRNVVSGSGKAKFWIEPNISLAMSQGIPTHELTTIEKIVKEHRDEIEKAWRKHLNN
jgi:hypothetical protein